MQPGIFHREILIMTAKTEILDYVPGALGRVVQLHGEYYSRTVGFGIFFETRVAADMAEFLRRFDPSTDGFWVARSNGRIEGSIAIDGARAQAEGAHLRWYILSDALRGQGIGNILLNKAIDHCRRCGYRKVILWTVAGLDAARHLYEKHGFRLAEEYEGEQWGRKMMEQRFVLEF